MHLRALATGSGATLRFRLMIVAALAVAALLALPGAAPAADLAAEQRLVASDATNGDFFGDSVDVEGDTAVVGASSKEQSRGAVYVFTRTGGSWTQVARLTASDRDTGDEFGTSVAINGNTIVVGAPGDDTPSTFGQGAVYTFTRTGAAARTETAKLTASDAANSKRLGQSVDIDGDTIVAGAQGDNGSRGAVYTFTRTGDAARTQTAKLVASDAAGFDQLGFSVRIQGDTIVAGAAGDDLAVGTPPTTLGDAGSVYTFASTGALVRAETAKLTASDAASGDRLGTSVAIDGDTIVAGALDDDGRRGAAYTFASTGAAARTQTARLTASDAAPGDTFGRSIAIDGDTIAVGAPGDDGNRGAAYTFASTGAAARTQTAKLVAADGAGFDFLGRTAIAIDGTTIIVGAPNATQGGFASIFFRVDGVPRTLTVAKPGQGQGTVTSSPAGITCGTDCTEDYLDGTRVTLTATPTDPETSTFAGFTGGGCTGTAKTCTVTLDAAKTVTATFDQVKRTLAVSKAGTGQGTVTSSPGGIDCGSACSADFPINSQVTLTAAPAAGSRFTGFTGGGCSGTATTCTVTLDAAKTVTAGFARIPVAPPPAGTPKPPTPTPPKPTTPPPPSTLACPKGNSKGVRCTGKTKSGGLVIVGTNGDDTIVGTGKGDRIIGGGGRDSITGGGGNDSISGGSGSDKISGGSGNDSITGGSGNDRIAGDSGNDKINGGSGNDRISGGSGKDRLSGAQGNDRLAGNSGNDRLAGGPGNDILSGGSGKDSLRGDSGNDRLSGNSGRDKLSGGSGKNRLKQ